ncbi:MAG: DNA-3-methyladenine glycosylase, partial [Oscillibacter sp.]|nr:DNA-3-methyladenine glycosylase [Oscillibacter sp.]
MARLSREFFDGDTVDIARNLLGKYLARRLPEPADTQQHNASVTSGGVVLLGRITETEAYVGRCDKACHAYNYRRTARTETLFLPPGFAYVY